MDWWGCGSSPVRMLSRIGCGLVLLSLSVRTESFLTALLETAGSVELRAIAACGRCDGFFVRRSNVALLFTVQDQKMSVRLVGQ
jgi:hypothetical protein